MEFARLDFKIAGVEVRSHDIDAGRVANKDYAVAELVGTEVEVEYRSVGIDNHFAGFNEAFHGRGMFFDR
jgi:hypothetical protein